MQDIVTSGSQIANSVWWSVLSHGKTRLWRSYETAIGWTFVFNSPTNISFIHVRIVLLQCTLCLYESVAILGGQPTFPLSSFGSIHHLVFFTLFYLSSFTVVSGSLCSGIWITNRRFALGHYDTREMVWYWGAVSWVYRYTNSWNI